MSIKPIVYVDIRQQIVCVFSDKIIDNYLLSVKSQKLVVQNSLSNLSNSWCAEIEAIHKEIFEPKQAMRS